MAVSYCRMSVANRLRRALDHAALSGWPTSQASGAGVAGIAVETGASLAAKAGDAGLGALPQALNKQIPHTATKRRLIMKRLRKDSVLPDDTATPWPSLGGSISVKQASYAL
jgi:hypothetical protein